VYRISEVISAPFPLMLQLLKQFKTSTKLPIVKIHPDFN